MFARRNRPAMRGRIAAYLRLDLDGLDPKLGRRGYGLLRRVLADHEAGWRVVRVTDRRIDAFEQQLAQLLAA